MKAHRDYFLAAALTVLAIGLTSAGAAQKGGGGGAPPPTTNDRIAFNRQVGSKNEPSTYQIFTMCSNGNYQTQMTFPGPTYVNSGSPDWFPDKRIAYARWDSSGANAQIWVMDLAANTSYKLADVPDCPTLGHTHKGTMAGEVAVSPDGSLVAFYAAYDGGGQFAVFVVSVQTGAIATVVSHAAAGEYVWANNFSPDLDGNPNNGYLGKLLYGKGPNLGSAASVFAVDVGGLDGNGKPVVGSPRLVFVGGAKAKWSPDLNRMRLAIVDAGTWTGYGLYALDIADPTFASPLNLANRYPIATGPSGNYYRGVNWDPTGTQVVTAFYPLRASEEIYKAQVPAGPGGTPGTLVRLTNNSYWDALGAWSLPLWP